MKPTINREILPERAGLSGFREHRNDTLPIGETGGVLLVGY